MQVVFLHSSEELLQVKVIKYNNVFALKMGDFQRKLLVTVPVRLLVLM